MNKYIKSLYLIYLKFQERQYKIGKIDSKTTWIVKRQNLEVFIHSGKILNKFIKDNKIKMI